MVRQAAERPEVNAVAEGDRVHRHLGLQGKTTALLLAVMFAAGVFAVALQLHDSRRVMYGVHLQSASDMAANLAIAAAPHLSAGDRPALDSLCARMIRERPSLRAVYVTAGKDVISAARRGDVAEPSPRSLPRPGARLARDRQTGLVVAEVSHPVPALAKQGAGHSGGSRGYVRLVLDASAARQSAHLMAHRLLQLMAGLSLITVPLTFLIVRRVVHPVNQMAEAARRFAQDDLSPRVRVRGTDEIAALGHALNAMADGLTASRNEMIEFNAALGRQVEQRTKELRDLAARDPLTNLYNRRHFGEALTSEFAAAVRYHEDLSLMMVDLDNFKGINDNHGHDVGDAVLIMTAKVISDELRTADIAARYGGDEFIVLLPHTLDVDAEPLATRIRESLRQRAAQALPGVPVDVSVGIASLRTTDALSSDILIREVDKALYSVKRSGKGRIAVARGRGEPVVA